MSLEAMPSLAEKVVIVTGASSGLGAAIARSFSIKGARLVITARRESRLRAVAQECGAIPIVGDASLEATAQSVLDAALSRFGRVDILINCAGQGFYKPLLETSLKEYDELMNSNMRSSFVFTRVVAPQLVAQRSGQILFVSSVAGLVGTANEAVYSATKFAQAGFAQAVDGELRPYGIKVSVLFPGGIKTEFAIGRGRTEESVATSEMMDADELAESIVFVCSLPDNLRIPQMTLRHM
jgi:NADP-dependent 3-hydroxy acid dehydrogenase YdfG